MNTLDRARDSVFRLSLSFMKNTITAISEEVILWKHAGCLQMAEIKDYRKSK